MTTALTTPATAPESPASTAAGVGLSISSIASVQFGAALAAHLFSRIGPLGTVSLRLVGAALVMLLITRPWRYKWNRGTLGASLLFGVVLTVMNTSLYLSLERLPLATVITIEFLGPLLLAIVTATSWATRGWAVPAGVGVLFLGGTLHAGDLLGIGFALFAAACWATYIVLSGRLGRGGSGLTGLAVATSVGALIMLPVGAATAGAAMLHPGVLAVGLAVGVLSSAIPYSLDLLALRRLPTAVFGVLLSLNPGVAALAGFAVLGENLPTPQLAGVVLVMIASAGVTVTQALRSRALRSQSERPAAGGAVSVAAGAVGPSGGT